MENYTDSDKNISLLFLVIPTIFVIIGLVYFPYPLLEGHGISQEGGMILQPILLFSSLALLLVGFLLKEEKIAGKLKIGGWAIFSLFWATKINELYFGVDGDFVNAFLCIVGIYLLCYLAYHEWLSLKSKKQIECLNWAAGVAAIAGLIYFVVELTPLNLWLTETVATHSAWVLNLATGNAEAYGINIFCEGVFAVNIIFACTAIQSMVLFIGGILPLQQTKWKIKIYGLLITVVPIYLLNLLRNALIAYLVKDNHDFFFMAHNVIGKGLSLLALILLLIIVAKIIPEIFDEIISLTDLPKRNGPLEQRIKTIWRKS
jgi:archaeosortase A (PGF-CTERM-specific)